MLLMQKGPSCVSVHGKLKEWAPMSCCAIPSAGSFVLPVCIQLDYEFFRAPYSNILFSFRFSFYVLKGDSFPGLQPWMS
jgi:hypothetical protein